MAKKFLNSIALCFSGGGYRAACFSLGTLSLFEHIGLLPNVKAISTVSGGTITGAKYAESQIDGSSFDDFFQSYYKWLEDNKLAETAIKNLKDKAVWKSDQNAHKRRNPINAFAIEYNKFTNHRKLAEVERSIQQKKTHLLRVVFNAADMTYGTQFRFQNSQGRKKWIFGHGKLENKYRSFKNDVKLGDIIAASSAFPGGFEPIAYPHDFVKNVKDVEAIGLMDGGTIDNQGSSIFTMTKKSDHDLHFISDVSSPYIKDPFKFGKSDVWVKAIMIFTSLPVLLLFAIISFITLWEGSILAYSIFGSIALIMLIIQAILFCAYRTLKARTGIEEPLKIAPSRIGVFMFDRAKSLLSMAMDVFLKNDRRQHADLIYSKYRSRTATATVYELRCDNEAKSPENENSWPLIKSHINGIPENICAVSKKSTAFGTTLWFTEEDKKENILDTVIACGEFTSCYNLLAFLILNFPKDIKNSSTEAYELYRSLELLWKQFCKNPYYLVNLRKHGA